MHSASSVTAFRTACHLPGRPLAGRISADVAYERSKEGVDRCLPARDCRHRFSGDSNRAAFRTDHSPDGTLQDALQGPCQSAWSAHDGEPSPQASRLSQACRAAAVSRHHQAAGDPQVVPGVIGADFVEGWRISSFPPTCPC